MSVYRCLYSLPWPWLLTLNLNSLPLGARANSHSNGDSSKIQLILWHLCANYKRLLTLGGQIRAELRASYQPSPLPMALQAACKHSMLCGASVAFVRETENLLSLNPLSLEQAFKIIRHNFCVFWVLGPWSKACVLLLKLLVLESLQAPHSVFSHYHHWDWASYAGQLLCSSRSTLHPSLACPGLLRSDIHWLWHSDPFVLWLGLTSVDEKFSPVQFSSVQFSRSVMSDSSWPHELQHAEPPCWWEGCRQKRDKAIDSQAQASPPLHFPRLVGSGHCLRISQFELWGRPTSSHTSSSTALLGSTNPAPSQCSTVASSESFAICCFFP